MADFRINVIVDPTNANRGSREVERGLGRVENSAARVQRVLARAFAFVGVGLAIRQLASFSDSFIELRNRALIANDGVGDVTETIDALTAVALRTRAPVADLTALFQRGALAARELGASQQDLFTFVEAVGQALAIQGGAVAQARGAIIQLSQSLGSVNVRAEEFNSIQEGAFPILQAAARGIDEAGGSVTRLRRLVIEGQITSQQFFEGILSQAGQLGETFSLTEPTIRQAFIVLESGLIRASEQLEQFARPLAAFIRDIGLAVAVLAGIDVGEIAPPSQVAQIQALADTISDLGRVAAAVGGIIAANLVRRGILFLIDSVRVLTAVIAANPIGALIVGAVAAVSFLTAFADQISITGDEFISLQAFGEAAFEALSAGVSTVAAFFRENFGFIASIADTAFDDVEFSILGVLTVAARVIDGVVGLFRGGAEAIELAFNNLPAALELIFVRSFNATLRAFGVFVNGINTALNVVLRQAGFDTIPLFVPPELGVSEAAADLGAAVSDAFARGLAESTSAEDALTDLVDRAREIQQQSQLPEPPAADPGGTRAGGRGGPGSPEFQELLDDLRQEADLLRLTSLEREIAEGLIAAEDEIKRELTETERNLVEAQLRSNQELQRQADILDEIQGPLIELQATQDSLRTLFDDGRISLDQFNEALRSLNVELTALDNTVGGGLENGLARITERANELGQGVSDIVVGAFDDATDAIVEFAETGELNFRELVGSILEQVLRLAANQAFAALVGGSGAGGVGGGLGGLVGAVAGGAGGGAGVGVGLGSTIGNLISQFAGFQTGAEGVPVNALSVGNLSGGDNRLVAFRARSDETIDVNRRGEEGGGRPINVNFNIQTQDADSFRRSQSDLFLRAQTALRRAQDRSGG